MNMRTPLLSALTIALVTSLAAAHGERDRDRPKIEPQIEAPGGALLNFAAPSPGTYTLPILKHATDGDVLTIDGTATRLHAVFGNRIVLLSLIYTSCSDARGCPLALLVLQQVQRRLNTQPGMPDRVRLISLSFDPVRDKPAVMSRYGAGFTGTDPDWRFLTTASETKLAPILSRYGQSIVKEKDENGVFLGTFSHVLRLFLIDSSRRIRNIYSAGFLHADTLINDIKTLTLEEVGATAAPSSLQGAGDDKTGYDSSTYQTRTRSLQNRKGQVADLNALAKQRPLGLPAIPVPADNPLTPEKIELGRKLFFDRRLSLNNTFSCAMCHIPEQGFTSNELATAVGVEGRTVRRNTPTLYNVAYMDALFHDGRETTLEHQIWGPLLAKNEMANPSIGFLIEKLKGMSDYDGLFEDAFDGRPPTIETIGMAIASYERALISAASPYDHWYYGEQDNALSDSAKRGYRLFAGKARCSACHVIGMNDALFTDNRLHNTGVGYTASMYKTPATRKLTVAPGVFIEFDGQVVADASETPPNDLGRYEITQDPADRWKYKTPSLRNVSLTAPYMHNGSLPTLRAVVEFYNRGGIPNEGLDPLLGKLGLSDSEIDDLVAFLGSLTGDNVDVLVSDAFAAPIGDVGR